MEGRCLIVIASRFATALHGVENHSGGSSERSWHAYLSARVDPARKAVGRRVLRTSVDEARRYDCSRTTRCRTERSHG